MVLKSYQVRGQIPYLGLKLKAMMPNKNGLKEDIVEVSTMNAEFKMITRPGVFSHGRPDVGGVALSSCGSIAEKIYLILVVVQV